YGWTVYTAESNAYSFAHPPAITINRHDSFRVEMSGPNDTNLVADIRGDFPQNETDEAIFKALHFPSTELDSTTYDREHVKFNGVFRVYVMDRLLDMTSVNFKIRFIDARAQTSNNRTAWLSYSRGEPHTNPIIT